MPAPRPYQHGPVIGVAAGGEEAVNLLLGRVGLLLAEVLALPACQVQVFPGMKGVALNTRGNKKQEDVGDESP
jgi:hypothetical protein